MRRGNKFESQVNEVVEYINNIGYHAHKNHPHRTIDGIFLEGEPFDYEVFLPNYKAVFDCKECDGDTWRMTKKDIMQAERLKHCKNTGLEAYFLILFERKNLVQIDIDVVIKVLKQGKKSIKSEQGKEGWNLLEIIKEDSNGQVD